MFRNKQQVLLKIKKEKIQQIKSKPSCLTIKKYLGMLHNSCFTKIFVKNIDHYWDTGVEDIIGHQTDRIKEACTRDIWNQRETGNIDVLALWNIKGAVISEPI